MRLSRHWGHAAAAWSAVFAAVHLYWALGGTVGLAESAGEQLADGRPTWFVLGGLYGVATALVMVGLLAVVLAGGALPGRRRLLRLVGLAVAAVLLLRAVGVELLLLADPNYGGGAVSPAQRFWTLVLWNPWFLLGGVLFGLTGLATRRIDHPSPA